jgi:hypothetical protein
LVSATASPALVGSTAYTWTYDSFGNRLTQTGNGGQNPWDNVWANYANDASGNPHNQMTQTNARGVTTYPGYDAAASGTSEISDYCGAPEVVGVLDRCGVFCAAIKA